MVNWNDISDAPEFSLEGNIVEAKVLSVYDGDTIKCAFPLNNKMYKWNCRLSGVDTPEIRTRNKTEKEYGYKVRNNLREKILGKVVNLECGDFDKDGRLLVKVKCQDDDCSINDWLITNNFAFKYNGGTRKSWDEYLKNI